VADGRLAGRVAIVTGASRGLGRAMAERFAAEGAAVVVAARSEAVWDERLPGTIHEVAETIRAQGGQALAVRCDVGRDEDLVRLAAEAEAAFGVVDLLVNNAALTVPGGPGWVSSSSRPAGRPADGEAARRADTRLAGVPGILEMSLAGYQRHFQVGLFAAYRLMQLVLPGMIEKGRGAILNISSDASRRPAEGPYAKDTPSFIAYGGNKAALEHLTRGVAAQVARYGVTVNSLSPSRAIDTPGQPAEEFAEAAVRLALEAPAERTGWNAYTQEVLRPQLGRTGFIYD